MDSNAKFGGAATVFAKAQTITDDLFVASDGGLNPAAPGIARQLLPADPALLGNALQMLIALCRRGFSRFARYCRGARRDDDRSVGIAFNDGAVEAVLVVRAHTSIS
jgi:hypothetical protein